MTNTDKLIIDNIPLANRIAGKKKRYLPASVGLEDLRSAAYLGLVGAARRFKPERGSFHGFASRKIIGAIKDYLRKERHWFNRNSPAVVLARNSSFAALLEEILDCLPEDRRQLVRWYHLDGFTMKEIASVMNISEARVCVLLNNCKQVLGRQLEN